MDTLRTVKTLTLAAVGVTCLTLLFHSKVQAATLTNDYIEASDAGGTLNTASIANTRPGGTRLDFIRGTLWGGVDLYQIYLTGAPFLATTETPGTSLALNSQLFLFNSSGVGLFANDDTPDEDSRNRDPAGSRRSTIRLNNVAITPGLYYLGISDFDFEPFGADGNFVFGNPPRDRLGRVVRDALLTPSNASTSPLAGWRPWTGTVSTASNPYAIRLLGAQFVPATDPIFNNPGGGTPGGGTPGGGTPGGGTPGGGTPGSGSGGSDGPNTGNPGGGSGGSGGGDPGTNPGGGSGGSGGDPGTNPGGGSGGSGSDPGTNPGGGGSGGSGGGDPGTNPGGGSGGSGGDPGTNPGGGSGGNPGTGPGDGDSGDNGAVTVPEPSSVLGLITLAAIGFGTLRKRVS